MAYYEGIGGPLGYMPDGYDARPPPYGMRRAGPQGYGSYPSEPSLNDLEPPYIYESHIMTCPDRDRFCAICVESERALRQYQQSREDDWRYLNHQHPGAVPGRSRELQHPYAHVQDGEFYDPRCPRRPKFGPSQGGYAAPDHLYGENMHGYPTYYGQRDAREPYGAQMRDPYSRPARDEARFGLNYNRQAQRPHPSDPRLGSGREIPVSNRDMRSFQRRARKLNRANDPYGGIM